MRVIAQQPQGKTFVNRTTKIGRDITFLWSGANPGDDSADSLFVGSGVNPQLVTTGTSNRGTTLVTNSTGAIEWRLFDHGTPYTTSSGVLRKGTNAWTQGVIFKYRNATQAGTNTTLFNVTNSGSWNHRIFVNATGFVQVRNPSWTAGVFLTSDVALTEGDWVSVVVVWESANTRFYVNGVLQTQTSNLSIYTAGLERIYFSPVGIDILTAFTANTGWTGEDALNWHNNPWQLFKPQLPIANKLLNVAADYPTIYTPGSDLRSLQLTTPSKVNITNPITKGILFASSPNHGTTDAVNDNTIWDTGSISTVYGRGGLAWVYGRAQQSTSTNLSKPVSSQYYSLFAVLSLEITKISQITAGYYYAGPGFGHDFTLRIGISDLGKVYVTNGTTTVTAENATVPVNKVITIAATGETGVGTKIYLNGKLIHTDPFLFNTGTVTYQPRRISYTGGALPAITRPWYTYLTAAWTRPLTETEVKVLSQDPLQLFARPQALNKRLIDAVTFDVPQAITKSSYVQTANMPRKPVPVNRAHPLARNIVFATGAIWRDRDAVDSRVIYTEGSSLSSSTKIGRYGLTFLPSSLYLYNSVSNVSLPSYNSHTLMIVGNVEQENYPYSPADLSTNERLSLFGLDWGDNNSFQFRIDYRGLPTVGVLNNSGQPRYLKGSHEIFPLRKLGVAICVVEAGVGTTLYINGKVSAFTTRAESSRGGLVRRTGYAVNQAFGQHFNFNSQQYLSAGWSRALSPAEVQQISENPWQIFQQPSKFDNRYAEAVTGLLDLSRKFLLFFG